MSLLRRLRLKMTPGALVLVCISMLFTAAVYKSDNDNYHKLAKVQATAAANSASIAVTCHKDLVNINAAHKALREQSTIQIETSRESIASIKVVLRSGNVPPALVPLYQQALTRQHSLIAKEQALRATVKDVAFIC